MFAQWSGVRQGLIQALDQISDDQLTFIPAPGLWSLGQTVCHIAGTEDSWFRLHVTHELSGWEEADYKSTDYPTVTALKDLLSQVHARLEAYLTPLTDDDLDQVIHLPWNVDVPLGWVFWHILEHEIHHRGEVFLMLGLQGMETPDV